jgi:L-ascorbate metabolism protein UlaG (beta-lactamase superfamily)
MKITYISHATILIETANLKIVTDPWIKDTAYCNQWFLFPKPVEPELIKDADVVLYSHGHEDHLHLSSLQTINKNAKLFYPYSWFGGTIEFLNENGFKDVKEILNEETINFDHDTKVTYLSNNLDTILVIEAEDNIIVNINDALPSASPVLIDYFMKKIKSRWKKIDCLFSSYGGASYFPNTIHYKNKNDVEIAEARELFFLNNFCRMVKSLNPTFAIPFASDFVLLDDHQRWINESKFPRNKIGEYFHNKFPEISDSIIIESYPGDYFENGFFFKNSPYHIHVKENGLLDLVNKEYSSEIQNKKKVIMLDESHAAKVFDAIITHINSKEYIIPEEIRTKIKFAIRLTDVASSNVLNINFRNNDKKFSIDKNQDDDIDLLIEMRSDILLYSISNEWGGDAIIIGYGVDILINTEESITEEYENYCIRLLTRYPNTKEHLKKTPGRALKYLLSDKLKRKNLLNKLLGGTKSLSSFDPKLADRDLWLNKSKCDVCKACNI